MFRILISAVLVFQMQALAVPALMTHRGHAQTPTCEDVVVAHAGMSHLGGDSDCQGCEMPDCESMLGCSGLTAFAAPAVEAELDQRFARATVIELATHRDQVQGSPILPPPRA